METLDIIICVIAVIAILGQAIFPKIRHFIMVSGASLGLYVVWLKTGSIMEPLKGVPLDVMIILVGLTLFGDFILKSHLFSGLIKSISAICKGKTTLVYLFFSILIFLISALLNNYQAVLLLTPALIGILSQLEGIKKSYVSILLGSVIVLSNLGGASLPISDFPALYMFGQGEISFQSYVPSTTPLVVIATILVILTGTVTVILTSRSQAKKSNALSVAFTQRLYRNIKIDKYKFYTCFIVFAGMMGAWIYGVNPTIVTIIGLIVLAVVIDGGKFLEKKIQTLDPAIFIFYLSLFTVISTIQSTSLLPSIASWVENQSSDPKMLLIVFSTVTMVVTALVSAGPSTVFLLPVALGIADQYPPDMVLACFAMSICSGSSFFTFSATAGPLVQSLSEKYELTVEGAPLSFGFKEYLLPGIVGSILIYAVNLIYILVRI